MRTLTIEKTLYKFHELSESAQETALDSLRDINTDHDWWDFTYDYLVEDLEEKGITVDTKQPFYFELGRGRGVTLNKPRIDSFRKLATAAGVQARASVLDLLENEATLETDRYGHNSTTSCTHNCYRASNRLHNKLDTICEAVTECLYQWTEEAAIKLEREQEYLCSDEAVKETIEANDYEFDENGRLA